MQNGDGGRGMPRCPVCLDAAEGNHYGIACCRSCASFFKRCVEKKTVFNKHPPLVPGAPSAECDVVSNRNRCKACRFFKCVEVGMKDTMVQAPRGPTGSQPMRKRKNSIPPSPDDKLHTPRKRALHPPNSSTASPQTPRSAYVKPSSSSDLESMSGASPMNAGYGGGGGTGGSSSSAAPSPAGNRTYSTALPPIGSIRIGNTYKSFVARRISSDENTGSTDESVREYTRGDQGGDQALSDYLNAELAADKEYLAVDNFSAEERRIMDICSTVPSTSSSEAMMSAMASSLSNIMEAEVADVKKTKTRHPPWYRRHLSCTVCPGGVCNFGQEKFLELVAVFGFHFRQMQLTFHKNVGDYVKEINYGITLSEMTPHDIEKLSTVELGGLLFWAECMGHLRELPEKDQDNLLKRYSVRKLSLDHFYSASKYPEHCKTRHFVLNNYTFVTPDKTGFETLAEDELQRKAKAEVFRSTFERFWTNVIDRFVEMKIKDPEIVFIHLLLMWSPQNQVFVSDPTKPLLKARRAWTVQMMFEYYYNTGEPDPELRVGQLVNLFNEIERVVDLHCADVHVAKLFDYCDLSAYWYDETCYGELNMYRPYDDQSDDFLATFCVLSQLQRDDPMEVTPCIHSLIRNVYVGREMPERMQCSCALRPPCTQAFRPPSFAAASEADDVPPKHEGSMLLKLFKKAASNPSRGLYGGLDGVDPKLAAALRQHWSMSLPFFGSIPSSTATGSTTRRRTRSPSPSPKAL